RRTTQIADRRGKQLTSAPRPQAAMIHARPQLGAVGDATALRSAPDRRLIEGRSGGDFHAHGRSPLWWQFSPPAVVTRVDQRLRGGFLGLLRHSQATDKTVHFSTRYPIAEKALFTPIRSILCSSVR